MMMPPLRRRLTVSFILAPSLGSLCLMTACGDDGSGTAEGVPDELRALVVPENCESCHPTHYREWLGSMHAYAVEDPVFVAMNKRYIRETGDQDPDFCVRCHAPLAVEFGYTKDGLNLQTDEVPEWAKGVTCYFCHNSSAIENNQTSNNPLILEHSDVMYGAFADAVPAVSFSGGDAFHKSAASPLHDGDKLESSAMCGTCHDVVNAHGVHLERTFAEWQESIFADPMPVGPGNNSCANNACHMRTDKTKGPISVDSPGVALRARHAHAMVGVDVALTNFPDDILGPQLQAEQRAKIPELRANAICASLCVKPQPETGTVEVSAWLHNEGSGHSWPSGAAQDRRAWAELSATKNGTEVFGFGHVAADEAVVDVIDADPNNWGFFDRIYDNQGHEVHMFWDAQNVVSTILPANNRESADPEMSSWKERRYTLPYDSVDRIELRVNIRPMAREVLEDLVASGDLDRSIVDRIETFDVPNANVIWPTEDNVEDELQKTFIYSDTNYGTCVSSSQSCRSPFICSSPKAFACRKPPS